MPSETELHLLENSSTIPKMAVPQHLIYKHLITLCTYCATFTFRIILGGGVGNALMNSLDKQLLQMQNKDLTVINLQLCRPTAFGTCREQTVLFITSQKIRVFDADPSSRLPGSVPPINGSSSKGQWVPHRELFARGYVGLSFPILRCLLTPSRRVQVICKQCIFCNTRAVARG